MKKNANRILAILTALCTIASCLSGSVWATTPATQTHADNIVTATAIFDKEFEINNFKSVKLGSRSKLPGGTLSGGDYFLVMNGTDQTIDFDMEKVMRGDLGSEYDITIHYKDSHAGHFRLIYNSIFHGETRTRVISTKGTGLMESVTFSDLRDIDFINGLDGDVDFRISNSYGGVGATSPSTVYIKKVEVVCRKNALPVIVGATTDETGHTFEWYKDEKLITNTFINYAKKDLTLDVEYRLVDSKNVVRFTKQDIVSVKKGETLNKTIDVGELDRCDLYSYEVEIKCDETGQNTLFNTLPVAIIKSDENKILNEHFGWATHIDGINDADKIEQAIRMMVKSNASFIRDGVVWGTIEWPQGELSAKGGDVLVRDAIRKVNKEFGINFEWLMLLYGGNTIYTGYKDYTMMPTGEYNLDKTTDFARQLAREFGDIVSRYEVWNEPNSNVFNPGLHIGQDMINYFNAVKRGVLEVDPTAKFGGVGVTGINFPGGVGAYGGREYITKMMDAGLWKYQDAFTYHGYPMNNDGKLPEDNRNDPFLLTIRDRFKEVGKGDIPFWNTENGYTDTDYIVGNNENKGALLTRQILHYRKNNICDLFAAYNFEKKDSRKNEREANFGHVSGGREGEMQYGTYFLPDHAFVITTGYNYVMAKTKVQETLDDIEKDVFMTKQWSDKFNKNVLTLHTARTPKQVTLDLGVEKVTLFDCRGNERELYGNDGIFTINTDTQLQYLVADLNDIRLVDAKPLVKQETLELKVAKGDKFTISMKSNTDEKLTARAALPRGIELISMPAAGGKDGTFDFEFRNLKDVNEEAVFEIEFLNSNQKIVQIAKFVVQSIPAAELSVSTERKSTDGDWSVTLNVKNSSTEKNLSGYVEFETPQFMKDLGKIKVGITPTLRSRVIKKDFVLERPDKYVFQYKFTDTQGNVTEYSDTIAMIAAEYAKDPPQIDGVLETDEWAYDQSVYVDSETAVVKMTDWGGKDDISAKSAVMWDEDNFYLYTEVKDDVHYQDQTDASQTWNGDSLQIGLIYGDEGFLVMGNAGTTFHELCFALTPEGAKVYRHRTQSNAKPGGEITDADIEIKRDETKKTTIYECRIPWTTLLREGDHPKANETVGFSFLVNDNDGAGRRGWMEHAGGIGSVKDSSLFTPLDLLAP